MSKTFKKNKYKRQSTNRNIAPYLREKFDKHYAITDILHYHYLLLLRRFIISDLRSTEASMALLDDKLLLYPVGNQEDITLEVKYNEFLLSHLKQVIDQTDKMQISNSKYCRARKISKRGRI